MINALIGAGILMFFSLCTGNAKIAGTGLTLWIITVFWNVHLMLNHSNMNFGAVATIIDNKYETAKENKELGKQLLYGFTVPMIVIGLVMLVIILIMFFYCIVILQ